MGLTFTRCSGQGSDNAFSLVEVILGQSHASWDELKILCVIYNCGTFHMLERIFKGVENTVDPLMATSRG